MPYCELQVCVLSLCLPDLLLYILNHIYSTIDSTIDRHKVKEYIHLVIVVKVLRF